MRNRAVTFVVEGDPIAKARARMRYGASKYAYNSQSHDQNSVKFLMMQEFRKVIGKQLDEESYFTGPCRMEIDYYIKIVKSHNVPENSWHIYKPDIDNLDKWILDCANSILYKDDCIICSLSVNKRYSSKPRTEITIKEL